MCKYANHVHLKFVDASIPEGSHICWIFDNQKEPATLLPKFFKGGLDDNEMIWWFLGQIGAEAYETELENMGVDVPTCKESKQLRFSPMLDDVWDDDKLIPEKVVDRWRGVHEQAIASGYRSVRGGGDMGWLVKYGKETIQRVIEFESRFNTLTTTHPITAICLYNASLFDGATILDALRTHPMTLIRGQIMKNPYYIEPEEFLSMKRKHR
ncbi:MAG: MEDS domain-containing protein [Methylococcaceae bacterium]